MKEKEKIKAYCPRCREENTISFFSLTKNVDAQERKIEGFCEKCGEKLALIESTH